MRRSSVPCSSSIRFWYRVAFAIGCRHPTSEDGGCLHPSVHGSRFTVHGSRFTVHGSRFMVHGSWFMVHGSRFTVQGSGGNKDGLKPVLVTTIVESAATHGLLVGT